MSRVQRVKPSEGYTRTMPMISHTITCAICEKEATVLSYPGRPPVTCSDECKQKYTRKRNTERVKEHRARGGDDLKQKRNVADRAKRQAQNGDAQVQTMARNYS